MRKRARTSAAELDEFADEAVPELQAAKRADMSARQHTDVKASTLKLVSTRVPVELVERLGSPVSFQFHQSK